MPKTMAQEKGPVFPDWTRMASHYATFQEFQRDKNLADWRLEEALIRLVGQGHGMNFKAN